MGKKKKTTEDTTEELVDDGDHAFDEETTEEKIINPIKSIRDPKTITDMMPVEPINVESNYFDIVKNLAVHRSIRCTICRNDDLFNAVNYLAISGCSYTKIIDRIQNAFPDNIDSVRITTNMLSIHFKYHFQAQDYLKELTKVNPSFKQTSNYDLQGVNDSAMQALLAHNQSQTDYLEKMKGIAAIKIRRLLDLLEEKERQEADAATMSIGDNQPLGMGKDWMLLNRLIDDSEKGVSELLSELDKRTRDTSVVDILRVQNFAVKMSEEMDVFFAANNIDDKKAREFKDKVKIMFSEISKA